MEWISVKDGLPENDELVEKHCYDTSDFCFVIAYGEIKGGLGKMVKETTRFKNHKTGLKHLDRIVEEEKRSFEKWYWGNEWKKVTHWMPKPEPPKENKD